MEEPMNEYDGPNPLEQLAERIRIHVEKGEFPLARDLLDKPENERLRKWAVVNTTRHSTNVDRTLHGRIERAIRMRPKAGNSAIARDLHCSEHAVRNVRDERRSAR